MPKNFIQMYFPNFFYISVTGQPFTIDYTTLLQLIFTKYTHIFC